MTSPKLSRIPTVLGGALRAPPSRLQASEVPAICNQSTVNAPPKPTFITPNLEAIRKLRKTRGVSRKSCLIGMLVENEDASHTPSGRQGTTPSIGTNAPDHIPADVHIDATTQALQEAITKGVDITFKKMFTSSQFLPSSRPSPRRRKGQIDEVEAIKGSESKEEHRFMLEKVRNFFKTKFEFTQDTEFMIYEPVDPNKVRMYESGDGPGPDLKSPKFDLRNNSKSQWSSLIIDNFLKEVQDQCLGEDWLKYARRATVLDHIIKLKREAGEDDINVWKWLQGVVQRLGEHGMSSEESDIENEVEQVLHVKRMDWCCGIKHELDFLDLQRLVNVDVFAPQESWPMKRIHASGNPATSRDVMKGLPRAFYNRAWITSLM
ncbi:hypothetical protein L210DRAFT_3640809 [Boletus edulis BED1]|uniref:Uncharacterized protein n=1 Tax=Boletus edulis BED1 TaxID=1328754 RepID=A0AAD4C572_BOLED|nr:hypothetical protein L210DRAFT_3640809 [Boletus edulis BED1]